MHIYATTEGKLGSLSDLAFIASERLVITRTSQIYLHVRVSVSMWVPVSVRNFGTSVINMRCPHVSESVCMPVSVYVNGSI